MNDSIFGVVAGVVALAVILSTPCWSHAGIIGTNEIGAIVDTTVGSGNGTLDLRMFTFSGSEIDNSAGSFDGDNGNNGLTQGGGADTNFFDESYVTTAGELQDYYILNFPNGVGGSTVNELTLFIDLNETGGGIPNNLLSLLDIMVNPTSINGGPNPSGDITSAQQDAINQGYSGGTLIANLDAAYNLPVLQQGAGFADYAIFTGIDPFALNANDVVLINMSMSMLNNGAEEVFLSGEFARNDLIVIPEPQSSVFVLLAMVGFAAQRRKSPRTIRT